MGRVKKGKYLSIQAKEIINSCRLFAENERHNYAWNLETHGGCSHTLVRLNNPIKRTSRACKVSRRAILKMKRDLEGLKPTKEEEFETQEAAKKAAWLINKKIKGKSTQMLGGYDLCGVRKVVHKLYEEYQKVPSLQTIYDTVREEIDFPWGQKTLRSNLNDLGFRWKETENKTKYLMEKSQIITSRSQFIRAVRNYRREGYEIVYTGETWIPSTYSVSHMPNDGSERRVEEGQKTNILHAGCKIGFVPNCLMVTESSLAKRGRTDDNRSKDYENWLRQQLIPNLPPKSIVIQSNDSHHCVSSEVVPTSTATLDEIKHWLSNNYIAYTHDMLKAELLSLVKMHKPKPEYRSDLILRHAGFYTLHLPPLHVDLNPIELIWPEVKSYVYVTSHNYPNANDLAVTHQLFLDACLHAGRDHWFNGVRQVIKSEDDYCRRDNVMEIFVDKLISGTYECDSSSDVTSSDSDSESEGTLNLPPFVRRIPEPKSKGRPKKVKIDEESPKKTKRRVKLSS